MSRFYSLLLTTLALVACTAIGRAQSGPAPGPSHIVLAADGAGNYQMTSKTLRAVVCECKLPIHVEAFVWSHGYRMILPDQMNSPHARSQGKHLAAAVLACRAQYPEAKIHLVGHSAGAMVVLAATECLPPASLECIVLLAPSVSTDYDIRPALRCVKSCMMVHYSNQDWFYLGLCMRILGCADGKRGEAGGRVGFQLRIECADDEALLPRLVQIPWQESFQQLGNDGGHFGGYQADYLKAIVLPVLTGTGN